MGLRQKYENGLPLLRVEPVGPEHSSKVSDALGAEEREAIALAQIVHADLLLIDDSDGRFEARRLGLRVTGTLVVLRVARRSKSPRHELLCR
jgi:predicted nucleic acid-binding protein